MGGGGYSATEKVTKYQDLPKYEFSSGGGWGGGILQLKKSQSTNIYLNMNFPEWGGYSATEKVTKYQDLPKYEFSKGGGVFCN